MAIATALVKVLERIESYDGDPDDVLSDALIFSITSPKKDALKGIIDCLHNHYGGGE